MRSPANLHLYISPKKWGRGLFLTCVVLFILNLIGVYFKVYQDKSGFLINAIYYFFNAADESSVQTIFSTFLLFLAAVTVIIIAMMLEPKHPTRKYWLVLGMIFTFLGLDESLTIHEQFNKLRPVLNDQTGIFYFSWIIPYSILAIGAGIFFIRFLFLIPPAIRNLFVLSGVIYVGAAIGFEIAEGYIVFNNGAGSVGDIFLPPIEEFLEMCGITLFIHTALRQAKSFHKEIELSFA